MIDKMDIAKERWANGKSVYIADPDNPTSIIRVLPDGTHIKGQLVNREFIPCDNKDEK